MLSFYEDNLSNKKLDYIYKQDNALKLMTVKFSKSNLPHLTGIDFSGCNAEEKIEMLKKGENTKPIYIGKSTFKKLRVLDSFQNVLQPDAKILTDLKEVKQAQRIGVNRAIKTKDNDLLLALYDFQPEIFEPKSLLNIKENNLYSNVPENTVFAIFKESKDQNTIHIDPIALNAKALGSIENATKMLIAVGKYAKEQSNLLAKEKHHEKAVKAIKHARLRGLDR